MPKTGVITASWVYDINCYVRAPWPELVQMHWDKFGYDELDGLLGRIAGLGFEYVELWLGHTGNLCQTPLWKGKGPDDIIALFAKHDLKLASFCPGGMAQNKSAEPLFEFGKALGAPMLTTWLSPDPAWWHTVADLLERYDTRFGIEPHGPEYSIATPEQILAACAVSPRIGACPDTGVFARQGQNAVEAVRAILPHVIHTHLKGYHLAEGHGCVPGDDDIGLDQVVGMLRDSGYQGVYSIEYEVDHNPDTELVRSREWLLSLMDQ